MKIFFIPVSICLPSEPSDLVIEAFLTGIGESMMFPKSKQSFDSLTYGLCHLLQAMDARDLCFFTPEDEGRSCRFARSLPSCRYCVNTLSLAMRCLGL